MSIFGGSNKPHKLKQHGLALSVFEPWDSIPTDNFWQLYKDVSTGLLNTGIPYET